MKSNYFNISILLASTLTLCSCAVKDNQNRFIQREVIAQKLSNGRTLRIGYKGPKQANQCKLIGQESHNWSGEQFESMFKMSGGQSGLKDDAVKYADKHPGVNYAYMYIPNQESVAGINVTMMRKATIHYYKCKNAPALHSNPFKA